MTGRRDSNRRIFIGNLPSNVVIQEVKDHFQKYGKILAVELRTTRQGWCYPQIAFVEFEDLKSAAAAIKDTNQTKFGDSDYTIHVCYSWNSHQQLEGPGIDHQSGHGIGRRHYGRRSYYGVRVTGLPKRHPDCPEVTSQELRDYMKVAGDICFAQVFLYGSAIVEYNTHEDMKKAVKMLNNTTFQPSEGPPIRIHVEEEEEYARLRASGRFQGEGRVVNVEKLNAFGVRRPSYSQQYWNYQSPGAYPPAPQRSSSPMTRAKHPYGPVLDKEFNSLLAMKRPVERLDYEYPPSKEGPSAKIRSPEQYVGPRETVGFPWPSGPVAPKERSGIRSSNTSPVRSSTLPSGRPSAFSAFYANPLYNYQSQRAPLSGSYLQPSSSSTPVSRGRQPVDVEFANYDMNKPVKREKLDDYEYPSMGPPTKNRTEEDYDFDYFRPSDTVRSQRPSRSGGPERSRSGIGSRGISPTSPVRYVSAFDGGFDPFNDDDDHDDDQAPPPASRYSPVSRVRRSPTGPAASRTQPDSYYYKYQSNYWDILK